MKDFEKLGAFYLGARYDLASKRRTDELVLYDSKDLTTHAVCVGMTGSGKTGLCIGLLEEAAIDGIPAIVIDPKGDLANLLLTFPELRPADFAPWVSADDAAKRGISVDELAAQQAALWKKGLAEWGQDGARIRRLRESADFAIYTPGSLAGIPVSVLKSFAAPPAAVLEDEEILKERVAGTATSLLGLLGIEGDPMRSREHILLSNLIHRAWTSGQDLDLGALIAAIQSPPFARVGVMDLESFFPAKERFALATLLNNLLASPGFSAWLEGAPLDVDAMLHGPGGKPRVSIFSIAHLGDAERMFFVSLLLGQTLSWVRTQSGSSSLRAIVYMDEIAGYFPPVANPPSKAPLLTLMKQARAFGVGVVLATQNPVDLDYKGLANAGTWFLGRLQTERDKARVLDGLEGAAANASAKFDRAATERILSQLGQRVFLVNDVHEDAPQVIETRWTLSYLSGPLARAQLKRLAGARDAGAKAAPETTAAARASAPAAKVSVASQRPVLPPEVPQSFLPARGTKPADATLAYRAALIGMARISFRDAKLGIDATSDAAYLAIPGSGPVAVDWDSATSISLAEGDLESEPAAAAGFASPPSDLAKAKSYDAWKRAFAEWLFRTQTLERLRSPSLGETSRPGEAERDFRLRLQHAARERRDAAVEALRRKHAPKIAALQERVRRAQQAVEAQSAQARDAKMQTVLSFGTALLSAFLGRKAVSATSVGKASSAFRGVGRSMRESGDVARAEETVESLRRQQADLEVELQAEVGELEAKGDPLNETLEKAVVRPKKADVSVRLLALAWAPEWIDATGVARAAWQ
ncbi:MAG TPA: DUF87 domain-containing protein [Planctomycetota bacterium]|nr:DUF87 domain-containing protein [Planctomycetota bacterium]